MLDAYKPDQIPMGSSDIEKDEGIIGSTKPIETSK
jgi:hypothetical protein